MSNRRFLQACAFAIVMATTAGRADDARVTLGSGSLRGSEAGDVRAFLGIPYATQPVGALRWQAPLPPANWSGERDATHYGPACPQGEDRLYHLTPKWLDEGCLYLNVWAPAKATHPLPVMVWLHGGAHRMGSGSLPSYDGSRLAARGVIVVTLNYRLGYLGYFAHPGLEHEGKAGNFGLMDQIAALRWVHDNIAAFGGDPAQVTLFGESAGGADVLWLMTGATGRDLFRAAIVESGGGWNKPLTRVQMQKKTVAALATVGVKADADAQTLRALDAGQLVSAQADDHDLAFGPFVDDTTVLEAPWKVFASGREAKVPLIIGSNDWEASLLKFRKPGFWDWFLTRLPAVSGWYEGRAKDADGRRPLLFRDIVFAAPARWIAAQHTRQAPAWLYRFSYVTSSRRGQVPGAGHAAELAYVFDTLAALPAYGAAINDEDRGHAATLADCWTAFAKAVEPRCGPAWKPYDPVADNILLIDRDIREANAPDAQALNGVTRYFGPGGWLDK